MLFIRKKLLNITFNVLYEPCMHPCLCVMVDSDTLPNLYGVHLRYFKSSVLNFSLQVYISMDNASNGLMNIVNSG